MGIRENYDKLKSSLNYLNYQTSYISDNGNKPYKFSNLNEIKKGIEILEDIDFLKDHIDDIKKNSGIYDTFRDEDVFTGAQNTTFTNGLSNLKTGIRFLLNYYNFNLKNDLEQNAIAVRLPDISTFDDLTKVSGELKKSIELPIIDSAIDEGKVEIYSAEQGSIWLMIGLGSVAAVNLVASVCWAAMVIRKKRAEAKIFEAQAKTLDLKNDALESIIDAQKIQIKNLLNAEAEAIASKHYDIKDPETIKRLELSINTTADLIDRGAKILPANEQSLEKGNFPDYKELNLLQSAIKQIREN